MAILCLYTTKQSSYTEHIHAALEGGGPRWHPLNVSVTTSERQDAGGELPGRRDGDGGIQLQLDNGGTSSSAGAGSGVAIAACAPCWIPNFAICIRIIHIWPRIQHFHSNRPVKMGLFIYSAS